MAAYLLRVHIDGHPSGELLQMMQPEHQSPSKSRNPLVRFQQAFERRFARIRDVYYSLLVLMMENKRVFIAGFLAIVCCPLLSFRGSAGDFFPAVDSGQINLHVRAQVGTRVETAKLFDQVEHEIEARSRKAELGSIVDNLGLTVSGINRSTTAIPAR